MNKKKKGGKFAKPKKPYFKTDRARLSTHDLNEEVLINNNI
jgi:hypothetical protein